MIEESGSIPLTNPGPKTYGSGSTADLAGTGRYCKINTDPDHAHVCHLTYICTTKAD
jgi:hypothetical protein